MRRKVLCLDQRKVLASKVRLKYVYTHADRARRMSYEEEATVAAEEAL